MLGGGWDIVIYPESLFSVSFQLSFIAVFALVGMFQVYKHKIKAFGFFLGVVISSFVVQIVTMPFIVYHFGLVSIYSVLANVIAIPYDILCGTYIVIISF